MNIASQLFAKLCLICFVLLTSLISAADTVYLTLAGGIDVPQKISTNSTKNSVQVTSTIKQGKINSEVLAGVGVYLMDNLRAEAVFAKVFFAKGRVSQVKYGKRGDVADITPKVNSIQIRGYLDVVNILELGQIYIGGGIGLSQIKVKISNLKNLGECVPKGEKKTGFSWLVAIGGSVKVMPGISLGIEYNYKDLGKISGQNLIKSSLKSHSVLGRVMFSI
jgi:opacity protein-like surface antigen